MYLILCFPLAQAADETTMKEFGRRLNNDHLLLKSTTMVLLVLCRCKDGFRSQTIDRNQDLYDWRDPIFSWDPLFL